MHPAIVDHGRYKRRILIWLISLCFNFPLHHDLFSQGIRGIVLDFETDSAVAYANVYFNASFQGTVTQPNGEFSLNTERFVGQEIVISCIGYASEKIESYQSGKFYKVYLKPASILMHELVITHDDMPFKKKYSWFKDDFLGKGFNAARCEIENKEDLRLVYFKSNNTLEAYCDKPLVIQNHALGYTLTYYLDKFKSDKNTISYRGNFLFKEDSLPQKKERRKVFKRRKYAYEGSRMHFFRSLSASRTSLKDFKIYSNDSNMPVPIEQLIEVHDGEYYYLQPNQNLIIEFIKPTGEFERSNILFKNGKEVLFNSRGYFDPSKITWQGAASLKRVADLLPYEYVQ